MATTPALAQADGRTNPEPVSAYVVIIERNEAPLNSLIKIKSWHLKSKDLISIQTFSFLYQSFSDGQRGI